MSQFDSETAISVLSFPRRRESKDTNTWMPAYQKMKRLCIQMNIKKSAHPGDWFIPGYWTDKLVGAAKDSTEIHK